MIADRYKSVLKPAVIAVFAAALGVATKAASITMPYRLSYWEGIRFHRWVGVWYGANAVALACVTIWMRLASARKEKNAGQFVAVAFLLFFFLAHPTWIHSISSAKNLCINQQREIDRAKEQWAELNGKKDGDDVDIAAVIELMASKTLPDCPDGGPYRIGRVGEVPRCTIEDHNLKQ